MAFDREERLRDLMNKAARGDFALKDPETGEKLSPEETQAEIMRRIEAARTIPEDHQKKLAMAEFDDQNDVPRTIRAFNVVAEMEGRPDRLAYTPGGAESNTDDEMQALSQQAADIDADEEQAETPVRQRDQKPGPR